MTWPGSKTAAEIDRERRALASTYPGLTLSVQPRGYVIDPGVVLQLAAPIAEGRLPIGSLDLTYDVAILLSRQHPKHAPLLLCRDKAIGRHDDRHVNETGFACLCARSELATYYPAGASLADFVTNLVIPFLVGQFYFSHVGSWPGPERRHGAEGTLEAYEESLGFRDPEVVCAFLRTRLARKVPGGHVPCPCGSGRKLRECHRDLVDRLWVSTDRESAARDLADLELASGAGTRPRASLPLLQRYGLENCMSINR